MLDRRPVCQELKTLLSVLRVVVSVLVSALAPETIVLVVVRHSGWCRVLTACSVLVSEESGWLLFIVSVLIGWLTNSIMLPRCRVWIPLVCPIVLLL